MNVDFDCVGGDLVTTFVDPVHQLVLVQEQSRPAKQRFQHRELPSGQVELAFVDPRGTVNLVELQAYHLQERRIAVLAAAGQGADTRFQFGKTEGFGQIVVFGEIESAYSLAGRFACAQGADG